VGKLYKDSKVELTGVTATHYDFIMNLMSLGYYAHFIKKAVSLMRVQPGDKILDLGCGTGRNAYLMVSYLSEKGGLLGMDISDEMEKQFRSRFKEFTNVSFLKQRIDQPFEFTETFDKAFISFVIHGFPHEVREKTIQNVTDHLRPGGKFFILDYNEFALRDMPLYMRVPFKIMECPHAFDFIKRDWKKILKDLGFHRFREHLFFWNYARLLEASL
jgi:demethylmenaquinone methyltransferase/2-methoxy-6-polyprenyl-1,4-benzoquinol methylase